MEFLATRIGNRSGAALAILLILVQPGEIIAHLDLMEPVSRYGGNVLKFGPCGTPDGQRSDRIKILEPGATIEVVWNEYVDHPGHYRIAFDDDGDDDFADPPCMSGCDTFTPEIELYSNSTVLLDGIADTAGGIGRATVTLPDIECDNCTLQVIQVMYDKPPYVIPGNDIYYQCADLVLLRPELGPCVGDCSQDGMVAIEELVRLVRISLGDDTLAACPHGDVDGSGGIEISELVAAVRSSLDGCELAS